MGIVHGRSEVGRKGQAHLRDVVDHRGSRAEAQRGPHSWRATPSADGGDAVDELLQWGRSKRRR